VTFGRNKKAQLATRTVFAIAQQHANHFREAWKYVRTGLSPPYRFVVRWLARTPTPTFLTAMLGSLRS
jgi:hypothetical protein